MPLCMSCRHGAAESRCDASLVRNFTAAAGMGKEPSSISAVTGMSRLLPEVRSFRSLTAWLRCSWSEEHTQTMPFSAPWQRRRRGRRVFVRSIVLYLYVRTSGRDERLRTRLGAGASVGSRPLHSRTRTRWCPELLFRIGRPTPGHERDALARARAPLARP